MEIAQRQFHAGEYSAAIASLRSALSQNSSNAEAYYLLGRSYYELRDFDSAIANAERSVGLDPRNSEYHQWLGRAYGEKADKEHSFSLARKVKKEFEEAVRLDPSNISARRDLEEYCIEAPWIVGGNKDEARRQVDAIAALDALEGHLASAAFDLHALKKPELAESEYRLALGLKSNRPDAYFEAANFYQKQNRPSDLEDAIRTAAQAAPSDPRLSFYRGVVRVLAAGDLSEGEVYLKSYLASTPERSDWPSHAEAREWLGRLYEAEGKRAEAGEQYRAALQLDPRRKESRMRLQRLERDSR